MASKDDILSGVREVLGDYTAVDSNGQPVTDTRGKKKLNTNMSATLEVNLDPANDGVLIYGSSDGGTTLQPVHTDAAGDVQVDLASFPSGTETPTASLVTDSTASPVASGKLCVTFTTSAGFAGTILGVARNPSTTYVFEAITPGKTLAAIAYTVTAGSMTIDVQS